jgi:pimeloyl-ACP methyl ester carboxylesterase
MRRAAAVLTNNRQDLVEYPQWIHFTASTRPRLPCTLYLPSRLSANPRILVTVHGVSRNADEHVGLFRQFAERYNIVLLAPTFAPDAFRDYQRLGRTGYGPRADLALIRLLNEVAARTGWDTSKVDMFGFSGGAQFAHRFTFVHPQRLRRLVLGSAGWYTMPDMSVAYPYGIADATGLDAARMNAISAVQLPTLVAVGRQDDNANDAELNRSKVINREQGRNRLERARRWTRAMDAFAARHGVVSGVELKELHGVDHSFRDAVLQGGLAARVFKHCYG